MLPPRQRHRHPHSAREGVKMATAIPGGEAGTTGFPTDPRLGRSYDTHAMAGCGLLARFMMPEIS